MFFLNFMGGGAWPFPVRGIFCLVDSDNERDLNVFLESLYATTAQCEKTLLKGQCMYNAWKYEVMTGL